MAKDEDSPLTPEWERLGISVDDSPEPDDADVAHGASVEEVDELDDEDGDK